MNPYYLLAGGALMIIAGSITGMDSYMAVGTGLIFMGYSLL